MHDVSKFINGFKRFRDSYFGARHELFDELVRSGQHPSALVVACSDSRSDPALLLDCEPGDLFVVRNVANLVPPYDKACSGGFHGVSAALEFGVCQLEVEHLILLGHAHCGGIRALMGNDGGCCGEFLTPWVKIAQDAKDKVLRELTGKPHETKLRACEQAALLVSLENLLSFPWIRQRVEEGRLALHAWYFDMEHGGLSCYDPVVSRFVAVETDGVPHLAASGMAAAPECLT